MILLFFKHSVPESLSINHPPLCWLKPGDTLVLCGEGVRCALYSEVDWPRIQVEYWVLSQDWSSRGLHALPEPFQAMDDSTWIDLILTQEQPVLSW